MGLDSAGDLRATRVFGPLEIVISLEVHPELRFTRVTGTTNSIANRFALKPSGFRKSSRGVSPGWMGGMVLVFLARQKKSWVHSGSGSLPSLRRPERTNQPPELVRRVGKVLGIFKMRGHA